MPQRLVAFGQSATWHFLRSDDGSQFGDSSFRAVAIVLVLRHLRCGDFDRDRGLGSHGPHLQPQGKSLTSLAIGQRKNTWLVCAIVWIVAVGNGLSAQWLLHASGTVGLLWLLRRTAQRMDSFARER